MLRVVKCEERENVGCHTFFSGYGHDVTFPKLFDLSSLLDLGVLTGIIFVIFPSRHSNLDLILHTLSWHCIYIQFFGRVLH